MKLVWRHLSLGILLVSDVMLDLCLYLPLDPLARFGQRARREELAGDGMSKLALLNKIFDIIHCSSLQLLHLISSASAA